MPVSTEEFKILVADDSPLYRKLVEDTLCREQYVVCFARNGRQASELLVEHSPALVITDWEMPDLTGIELCGLIRGEQRISYTYIILLTGNANKNQIVKGLAAGADDYLTKPFHPGELLARVAVGRRIIELHREIQAKNRLLEELTLTDSLTGLPNRRALEDWGIRQIRGAVRHGFAFWVVMADLDAFKSVNDTYGHQAGDVVLKKFADLLKANTRASNICGRIGGEEFVIVITHIEKPNIQNAIDRIRRELEAQRFDFEGRTLCVTASFGIAGFQPGTAADFSHLLREADIALYAAKRAGRNRIEFAEGLKPERQ
ncbi:MAG TPA: diguanylate cyclase [Terriglobales bacterium]|nr:diguanylate cyclase [Terriglobales bacterium]